MIQTKYEWMLSEGTLPDEFLKLIKKEKLDTLTGKILYDRGIRDAEKIEHFLRPNLEDLYDPFLLHDMEKAITRILKAIETNQKILVYGDYDADGMTAASVMKTAIDEPGG